MTISFFLTKGPAAAAIVIVVLVFVFTKPDRKESEVQVIGETIGETAEEKQAPPPFNISLELIPGEAEDQSLAVLRLFSRKLQQQKLNRKEVSPILLTLTNEHYEPPVYIVKKITELKKLLAAPER